MRNAIEKLYYQICLSIWKYFFSSFIYSLLTYSLDVIPCYDAHLFLCIFVFTFSLPVRSDLLTQSNSIAVCALNRIEREEKKTLYWMELMRNVDTKKRDEKKTWVIPRVCHNHCIWKINVWIYDHQCWGFRVQGSFTFKIIWQIRRKEKRNKEKNKEGKNISIKVFVICNNAIYFQVSVFGVRYAVFIYIQNPPKRHGMI